MNLRYKLADWISGGLITFWYDKYVESQINYGTEKCKVWRLEYGLNDIAAQEKPTSNATVRRMARMARETINV